MARRLTGPADHYRKPRGREADWELEARGFQSEEVLARARELELALIGCALMNGPETGLAVASELTAEDFVLPTLAECWKVCIERWENDELPDMLAVAQAVADRTGTDWKRLFMAVSDAYVHTAVSTQLPQRVAAVKEASRRRSMTAIGMEVAQAAVRGEDLRAISAYLTSYTESLDILRAAEETGEVGPVADRVEYNAEHGFAAGLSTGIPDYDEWSGGLRFGHVHVIAGAPKAGKTWAAVQITNAVLDAGESVCFFSLEMPTDDLYVRLMAGRIGWKAFRLMGQGRTWTADERAEYQAARERLEAATLRLFSRQRSLAEITATTRKYAPRVVVVDYVQLMDPPPDAGSRYEAITENVTGLQRLAHRADCTVVVLTQMSREAIRGNAPYLGGDGSGRIDQVGDFGLLMQTGEDRGAMELMAKMNRHGPQGGQATYRLDPHSGRLVRATPAPPPVTAPRRNGHVGEVAA